MTETGTIEPAPSVVPATAGRTPNKARTRRRAGAFVLLAVAGFTGLGFLATRGDSALDLHPDSATPGGSRALAVLLDQRGVDVDRVASVDDVLEARGPVTVFVPVPELVSDIGALDELRSGRVVLVNPGDEALFATPGIARAGSARDRELQPQCDRPEAVAAGSALVGGATYDVPTGGQSCYPVDGRPSLVAAKDGDVEYVVVGSSDLFTNEHLGDNNGNAALAVNLLSTHDRVLWLLPTPEEFAAGQASDPQRPFASYLPTRVVAAIWMLVIGVALLAVAHGRRLGRVVTEALPVVVRAAETVEGKARLYRAARARDRAAGWLRDAALHELRTRIGLPTDAAATAVTDAVAARTGVPREDVAATVYGPAPTTDRDLVALADALDRLTAEVRRQ